ncbi:glycosyl hydrolase 108 family protein [Spirosoma sp. SC4-14]|uniref:glycoside hydrolase family 108 protein n=1 Tax=Spirosoma sp. SC4-14 TaxID=3128900 RepID=UPI0030CE5DBB
MADFNKAFDLTMSNEGGLANHPSDKGGLTYKGITSRDWPNWPGWVQVNNARRQTGDTDKINRILANDAELQLNVRKFYKLNYWDVNKLDQFDNQAIAEEVFDTGVNCGWKTAAMMLQRTLNLLNIVQTLYPNIVVDGAIGPKTLELVNKHPRPKEVLKVLNGLQFARYVGIAENEESQEVFFRSWLSRVVMAA